MYTRILRISRSRTYNICFFYFVQEFIKGSAILISRKGVSNVYVYITVTQYLHNLIAV